MTKLCEVVWLDAVFRTDEFSLKEAKKLKPMKTTSIGFLVKHDIDVLTLCQTVDEEKAYSEALTIPAGMVVSVRELG